MKIGLVTTSINVPKVLSLYRAFAPTADDRRTEVMFFVAADLKTPPEAFDYCSEEVGECMYLTPELQRKLPYKSLKHIPWSSDSRRDLAVLEALRWGAEILISIDDDQLPMEASFFWDFVHLFAQPFNGLQLGMPKQWFNAGEFATPVTKQRGLPYDTAFYSNATPITNAQIGAAQGIILGVPDCDAATAITNTPMILNTSDVLKAGFVVDPAARAVFNSQTTAFRRELAPAFAQMYPAQGRNTDIFASLLMRRIMRERNLYTYFGPPASFHARQSRPLLPDLRNEMIGNERIVEFAEHLDRAPIPGKDVIEDCHILTGGFDARLFPVEFWNAWLEDCESVL